MSAVVEPETAGDPRFAGAELWPDTSDAVDAAVLFYGYHDGSQFFADRYYGTDDPAVAAAIDQVDHSDAPLLLAHGTADGLVPAEQSVRLAEAATDAGAAVELVLIDGEGHGFDRYGSGALTDVGREEPGMTGCWSRVWWGSWCWSVCSSAVRGQ